MEKTERDALVARFIAGPQVVADTLAAVPEDRLDTTQIAGEWTPRQIVHHLADSETHAYIRLRQLIADDQPMIRGYDQDEYARKLHYDRPMETSLAVLRAVRASSATLLAALTEDEWERKGTHSDSGAYSLYDWLRIYAAHCHDHADQMRRAAGI